jgi:hypothetical protein
VEFKSLNGHVSRADISAKRISTSKNGLTRSLSNNEEITITGADGLNLDPSAVFNPKSYPRLT